MASPIAASAGSGGVATAVAPAPAVAQATDEITPGLSPAMLSAWNDVAGQGVRLSCARRGRGHRAQPTACRLPDRGTLVTVAKTGRAFGITSDDGVGARPSVSTPCSWTARAFAGRRGEGAAGQRRRSARHGQPETP